MHALREQGFRLVIVTNQSVVGRGFNLIEFKRDSNIVNPLRIKRETLNELEYSSLLCFTGTTRRSGGTLQRQIESYEQKDSKVIEALERMKELTLQMKDSLTGNLTEFARLVNSERVTKKALDSAISTSEVDRLLHAARENGAIGRQTSRRWRRRILVPILRAWQTSACRKGGREPRRQGLPSQI